MTLLHRHRRSLPGTAKTPTGAGRRLAALPARVALACLLPLLLAATGEATAAVRYAKQVGGREVVMVVPDRADAAVPLVIALHGCDQDPHAFLASTRLETLVDSEGVALALPEAGGGADNPLGCWRWWDPANQRRDGPAPGRIRDLIEAMDIEVDRSRVYALGLSSGGAMAVILGTVYPDIFAAIGVHSGLGFAVAANAACALKALADGPPRVAARAELGYLHQPRRRMVPAMIIHGRDDTVVDPRHADGLLRELARRHDFIDDGDGDNQSFDTLADTTIADPGPCRGKDNGCYPHELERFEDREGRVLLQRVMVDRLGHAWSGGHQGHRHADPQGPDAAAMLWRFFADQRLDNEPPAAAPGRCRDWRGPPWWHLMWPRTMSFGEYACDMNPWHLVWRHRINGVAGPGRCP